MSTVLMMVMPIKLPKVWLVAIMVARTCRLTVVHGVVNHRLTGTALRSASKSPGSSA
jgi:hypothetical protein